MKPSPNSLLLNFLRTLEKWLTNRKIKIYCKKTSKIIESKNIEYIDNINEVKKVNFIISLGGDGTLIGICRSLKKTSIPIIGVNLGGLGFITNFTKNDIFDHLNDIINGKFTTSPFNIYQVEHQSTGEKAKKYFFVNDIVISKNDISRIFSIELFVDSQHVYNLSGDGLIISSPVGSTAYSLAAGGPIIHPNVSSMVITPICPHSLTHRPMVIHDKSKVTLKIPNSGTKLILTLDGQEMINLKKRDIISIKKYSRKKCLLIDSTMTNYYIKLKEKFTLGRK